MEESSKTDPATKRRIRVSVSVRKFYRTLEEYQSIRNIKLNEIVAEDFADTAGSVLHHFALTKGAGGKKEIGEIRGNSNLYYISAIRDNYIDILAIQGSWVKPKYIIKDPSKLYLGD